MEHQGAVAVEHALGIAGGPRGVAQRGRRILVELRPIEMCRLPRDHVFVGIHGNGWRELPRAQDASGIAQRNEPADDRRAGRDFGNRRGECEIEEQQRVLRIVDDVAHLLGGDRRGLMVWQTAPIPAMA